MKALRRFCVAMAGLSAALAVCYACGGDRGNAAATLAGACGWLLVPEWVAGLIEDAR